MFIEKPLSKGSLSRRKIVYGAGINDADYVIGVVIDGVTHTCPYYVKWTAMLKRCYSRRYQKTQKTYKGCITCGEWLFFSNFKRWMEKQDWQGKELDKDILVQGNKIYSPELCIFVTAKINKLLNTQLSKRGKYKIGVSFCKREGRFVSRCRDGDGNSVNLGYFSTELEAHYVYSEFKYKLISDIANKQVEPLKSALLNYIIT